MVKFNFIYSPLSYIVSFILNATLISNSSSYTVDYHALIHKEVKILTFADLQKISSIIKVP